MFNGHISGVQFLVCLVVSLGSFCYGYSVNITSSTLGQPSFQVYMALDGSPRAVSITSAIGVGAFAGACLGCMALPFGADRAGRKIGLYIFSAMLAIAGGLQAGSINASMFIATRVLVGVAAGALFTAVPVYQSEVAPAHLRGALIACHGTLFCMGSFTAQWLNVAFFFVEGDAAWRAPLGIQCIFPIALMCALRWVPESPRFLASKGRIEEAHQILVRLHSTSAPESAAAIEAEYKAIVDTASILGADGKWSELFSTPVNRKITLCACFISFFYAWTGINVIAGYAASLFAGLGMKPLQQILLFAGLVTFAPLGNFVAAFMVDRLGRIKMILIALSMCSTGLCIQTGIILRAANTATGQAIGVFSIFLFFIGFCTFYDVPCWAYSSEILPQHLRAKGFSLALLCYFIGNTITVGIAPTAFAAIGGYFYIVFIAAMVLAAPFFYFYFPETKNVPLEQIGVLFGSEALESIQESDIVLQGHEKYDGEKGV